MEQQKMPLIDSVFEKALLYRKECLIGGASLLAAGALAISLMAGGPSCQDFLNTKQIFAKWEASPVDPELFDDLTRALKKTPGLMEKYEAEIAQKLIEAGLSEKTGPYAQRALVRLERESPLHGSFAETTLLIEKGAYQEALEKAIGLKEQMKNEQSILYAHNLIRIACLQKELQNAPGEIAAWSDFEDFLGWKEGLAESPLSQAIVQSYSEEEMNLAHYIAERKTVLAH